MDGVADHVGGTLLAFRASWHRAARPPNTSVTLLRSGSSQGPIRMSSSLPRSCPVLLGSYRPTPQPAPYYQIRKNPGGPFGLSGRRRLPMGTARPMPRVWPWAACANSRGAAKARSTGLMPRTLSARPRESSHSDFKLRHYRLVMTANNRRGQRCALQVFHHNRAVRPSALKKRGGVHGAALRVAVGARLAVHQDFELPAGLLVHG
jgi:hypothetical protein